MCNTPKYAKLEERTGRLSVALKYSNYCKKLLFTDQYHLIKGTVFMVELAKLNNLLYVNKSVGSYTFSSIENYVMATFGRSSNICFKPPQYLILILKSLEGVMRCVPKLKEL